MFEEIDINERKRLQYANTVLSQKYDLDEILSSLMQMRQSFFEKGLTNEERAKFPIKVLDVIYEGKKSKLEISENVYEDIITLINTMEPSLLAPFYHYNNYIDWYKKDFLWDDTKYYLTEDEQRDSNVLRRTKYQIEMQALLISIKTALDRLVPIFSYYYKGIMPHMTFGRYTETKNKGLMHLVNSGKEKDELLMFIHDNYIKWINVVVAPRDMIIHYNDMGLIYQFDSEIQGEVPYHFNQKLIKTQEDKNAPIYTFNHVHFKTFIDEYFSFLEHIFAKLIEKEPITYRERI
jgi:hypothetical protein